MKALDMFAMVLENAENLEKEIREQVYKILDLNSESEKLNEMIQECIEHFNFNLVERKFLSQLQEVKEKLIILTALPSKNDSVDYSKISNSITDILRKIEANVFISLDDDFTNLADQISKRFDSEDYINAASQIANRHQINITREEIRNYLMNKRENIINMILAYNKKIVDSLVNLTPQLVSEMQLTENQNVNIEKSPFVYPEQLLNNFKVENTSENHHQDNNTINFEQVVNNLISNSKREYNELQRRISYLKSGNYGFTSSRFSNEIAELKTVTSRLETFIDNLSKENYVHELVSKYSNIKDLNEMCNYIIKDIPSLASVHNLTKENEAQFSKFAKVNYNDYTMPSPNIEELHNEIVKSSDIEYLMKGKKAIEQFLGTFDYDANKKLQEEYAFLIDKIIMLSIANTKNKNPKPTEPSNENAIGNSKDDIISLINSNQYFSILQAIPKAQADKYKDFINYGLNEMINRWLQKAELAKTYDERQISFQEYKTIFYHFENYIPLEVADKLRASLNEMELFLQQTEPTAPKNAELHGFRNNNSEIPNQSTMRM